MRCSAASAIILRRSSADMVNSTELSESLSSLSSPAPLGFAPLEGFSPGWVEDAGGAEVEGGQTNEVAGVAATVGD